MLELSEYLDKLEGLKGVDLLPYAKTHNISTEKNNGWFGNTLERCLGIANNTNSTPDLGDYELKTVSLHYNAKGNLSVREDLAITQIKPNLPDFEESCVFKKVSRIVVVTRIKSVVHDVFLIELEAFTELFEKIALDYLLIKSIIEDKSYVALSGSIGQVMHSKRKTYGKSEYNRAFCIRPKYVRQLLGL